MGIHRADPVYRKRFLLVLLLAVLFSAFLLTLLQHWLYQVHGQLITSDPDTVRRWLRWLLAGFALAAVVPIALLGTWLHRLGTQTHVEARFPPRIMKTLLDVRVLRGAHAMRMARAMRGA